MRRLLAYLPFPVLMAVRSHLGRHRLLSLLTLGAIAMSVALATGLEMASRSVQHELTFTADELAGKAQLEITAGDVGVPESLLAEVQALPNVRAAVPFVSAAARIELAGADGRGLHLLGVDLLADDEIRTYSQRADEVEIQQPLRMLANTTSVLVAESLAREFELEAGDAIPVRIGEQRHELRIRGILREGGVFSAFAGQIAVMDVYALQALTGRSGWLDRIDVLLDSDADASAVRGEIADAIAGRATVRRSATRDHWVEATLGTVQLVVWSLVAVAVVVASLLAYGATSLFVDRRSAELAMLRVAGLEGHRVERILYVDALLLAFLGAGLGVAGGLALGRGFLGALSSLTSILDGVEIERLTLSPITLAIALAIGVFVALLGSAAPARAASRRPPLAVLAAARAPEPVATRERSKIRALVLAVVVGAWLLVAFVPIGLPPLVRVGLTLAVGLLAVALGARGPLRTAFSASRPLLERGLPGIGRLVGGSLLARPARTGITIAAVAGVLAAVTVSGIASRSVTHTLDAWTSAQYPGGVMVTAGSTLSIRANEVLQPDVVAIIRETPGVEAVFESFASNILYRGEEVLLAATSMEVMAEHGRVPLVEGDPRAVAEAIAAGQIGISDSFARRFSIEIGDGVTLDTPSGPRTFHIAGILRDFAGPAGSLNLQIDVFDDLWSRDGARNLVVWTEQPTEPVLEAIRQRVGERQTLFFVYGDAFARYVSSMLGRFTTILDVVAGLTAVLGGLAILNLLLGAVIERRREFALLRSAGATQLQVALLVMTDGLIAGLFGGVAGIALGVACAWPLVQRVLPEAYGWTLDFHVGGWQLLWLLIGVAVASFLAGLYPAREAMRVAPREAFAPE